MQLASYLSVLAFCLVSSIAGQKGDSKLPVISKSDGFIQFTFSADRVPNSFTVTQLNEFAELMDSFKKEESGKGKPNKPSKPSNSEIVEDEATVERDGAKFEWCDSYEAEPGMDIDLMLKKVNEIRASAGVGALKLSKPLIKAAVWQAKNQAEVNKGGHNGPDGAWDDKGEPLTKRKAPFTKRILACKFPGFPWGETAAFNPGSVNDVMKSWMDSPAHRKIIVDPLSKYFGAAKENNYWVQTFGKDN